ncbi:WXG100 family type VII secretion target [Nocardia huaxiensis]|uniref:WXG100 family type VII secretion target n=1 Tax=Nocardia huaxiensis TaxID=2755382 RepID=UPI001E39C4A2|nr:WXG100 family type VII secretion target [Nocardia huaxiensis]UFT00271.1 WXG100 family type VII secretion target [Nocardia huaxiensis]
MKASVSKEAIDTFADECARQHEDLYKAIRTLKAREDETTATWSGGARVAFDSFMERYYYQADKLNDKLLETSESLRRAGREYETQDDERAQQVRAQVSSLDLPPV